MADTKQGELFPKDKQQKTQSKRAQSAQRKRQWKKSEAANQRQAEKELQINPENQPISDNVLTPEEIKANREGAKKARQVIEEGGNVQLDPPNALQIKKGNVDYSKTKQEADFDEAVNSVSPEGTYQRPPLENLREGVKIRNRNNLAIQGLTGVAVTGFAIMNELRKLMINPLGGAM